MSFFADYDSKHQLIVTMPEDGARGMVVHGTGREALWKAMKLNDDKHGVFITVQGFRDNKRVTENLVCINGWAVDLDEGSKLEMKERICKSPLAPTSVVETKRGFHVYWSAIEATTSTFAEIQNNLITHFGADIRAKDLCRVLRLPACFHWKDQDAPFLVQEVHALNVKYTEGQMLRAFPTPKAKPYVARAQNAYQTALTNAKGNFSRCIDGLKLLSGASELNGEVFEFARNGSGTHQILINGKRHSSWIAPDGHIGSYDRGGPGLKNWVMWYGYDKETAIAILRKYLGEEFSAIMGGTHE